MVDIADLDHDENKRPGEDGERVETEIEDEETEPLIPRMGGLEMYSIEEFNEKVCIYFEWRHNEKDNAPNYRH